MRGHPAHWIALAFGAGLSPAAAGTVGTLWAWLVWALLLAPLAPAVQAAVIALTLLAGWWAATVTARHLQSADPGAIVVDEVIAFWIVLWLVTPAGFWTQLVAFALFRFFDAVKPGPVGWADRLFKPAPGGTLGWAQGFGILFDDLVAAACTLALLLPTRALWS
ncbi:MAG TPA: phosphatidylglycerophosphatase A [Rubrivivax sp.]|nr:phosphatidylglycerophosphatase A [Rubrivivax sp.]